MPDRLLPFVKPVFLLLGTIVTFALGYADLRNETRGKASKDELRAVRDSVAAETRAMDAALREMDARSRRMEALLTRLVCRQYPQDLGCP